MDLLLDTTVLVDFLRGDQGALRLIQRVASGQAERGYISAMTVLELLQKPNLTPEEQAVRSTFGQVLPVLPITEEIAVEAGLLATTANMTNPKGIIFDAVIAATASKHRLDIVSRNTQDFRSLDTTPMIY
ncbi:MAG: PIN domain-containing protein [Dehalococcoidia bacterium]|nr:PIN domain-containing protein [Dehalococcoidia bacterium]